jgi:hypothetical protein
MKKYSVLIAFIILLAACGKKDPAAPAPGKSVLVFPNQNSLCTNGTAVSNTLSLITFSWNSSANTDAYQVDIKNLLTGTVTTLLVATTQVQVVLDRNTPYSWSVTSKSAASSTITQSDVWKFYNAGLGIISYAPFPATIISPTYGQNVVLGTGTVNLGWTDSDVDNDIVGYDIYFGANSTPPIFKSNVTDMFLNSVPIAAGNTYYWKVTTKDSQGNISNSDVYSFKVN